MMGRLRHLGCAPGAAAPRSSSSASASSPRPDRRAGTYSGGMARRLDLAMSLVSEPAVLFLDEPTTGLDPRSRRDVWDAVAALRDAGVTILLTTQYLEEADRLADRVVVLHGGRAVAEGTAEELKARQAARPLELVPRRRAGVRGERSGPSAHAHADPDDRSPCASRPTAAPAT